MEKGEHNKQVTNVQLSLEFSDKIAKPTQNAPNENSKVISFSEYKFPDKNDLDYSKLVLKHTKSF